jgi:outer membrane protein assembly factor BamB
MFGRNARHIGRTPVVGPQTAALRWSAGIDKTRHAVWSDTVWSAVVGADGTVYVGDAAGVRAIDPQGTMRWFTPIPDGATMPALGPGGRLYAGTASGLVALGPGGAVLWRYPSGQTDTPVVALDGTIYAIGHDLLQRPIVHAVRPDGVARWRQHIPNANDAPSIGLDGTVYVMGARSVCTIDVCFLFGRVYALDRATGRPRLIFENPDAARLLPPAIGPDGTMYTGSSITANVLYALRPDGTLRWRQPIAGGILATPALGWDGTVYVGGGDAHVYAIRSDGTLAWRYPTHGVGGPG